MEKQKKKQKGITLIALVISIIVMLILAGVSLNMTVGDNGIISQAQAATFMQSCAVLEEFINEQGVQDYVDEEYEGTAFIDLLRLKHSDWIYKNEKTGLPFLLVNGKIYYVFQKENLPDHIRNQIRGGDAGEKTYDDYVNFRDVYGVTSDLKVYYCSDGLDSRVGAADELLEDNATRVALKSSSSSGLADYLAEAFGWVKTDENGNVLAENLSSVKTLTIDSTKVRKLTELYNLSSLQTLTLKNASLDSLEGLDLVPNLTSIIIENSTCGDYTALSKCASLKKLYLTKVNQSEATGCLTALASMRSSSLEYFGIYDSPNVTDMTKIDEVSTAVKGSVRYLYLYGDSYSTVGFTDFNNLYELKIYHEVPVNDGRKYDTTLKSITSLKSTSLQYLYCYGNYELSTISNVNVPALDYLHLQYDFELSQASIDEFSESSSLIYLYLYRCYLLTSVDSVINGNKALLEIDIRYTQVPEVKKLKGNTTLVHFYAEGNKKLTTLEGLENCTNLYGIYCSGCNSLGKDCDTSYNSSTGVYTAKGKSSTNALYALSNKTNLYRVNLQNCYYIKYFSYLKNSGQAVVDYCYLYGSSQLDSTEVTEAKPFLNKARNVNMPANISIATLDTNTTAIRLEQQTITDADLRQLKNKTNIESIIIGGMTIKNATTGAILTAAQIDSLFYEVFSTCTGVKQFYTYQNISDISFVKNMNNLQYLMIYRWTGNSYGNCTVGTKYTDASGNKYHQDASGNPTGLELLNTYCPNLRALRIWNYPNDAAHHVDLSAIQPAINKMNQWAFPDNRIDDVVGFYTNNQWIADTMASCTTITDFLAYNLYCTYDLSNCKSLKNIQVRCWNGNWNEIEADLYRGHIKLPTTYVVPAGDTNPGYSLIMHYPSYNTIVSGGAGCRELTMNYVRGNTMYGNGDDTSFANQFTGLNQSYLKKVTIKANEVYADFLTDSFLTKLSNCTSLNEINFTGYQAQQGNIRDLTPLSTMTGLTKIVFNYTNVSVIPNITALPSLTYLQIQYSSITDISGLYKDNNTVLPLTELYLYDNSISNLAYLRNLGNLTHLDLRNNSIGNTILSSLFGTVDNVSEINNLKTKYNHLTTYLWIRSGNKFEDTSGLSWAKE